MQPSLNLFSFVAKNKSMSLENRNRPMPLRAALAYSTFVQVQLRPRGDIEQA
jgi:hypothetical protein